jgi:type I restriction enzyme S subunit
MSRIEDLIEKLCPGGVTYRNVDSLLVKVPVPDALPKNEYRPEGHYPVINQAQNLIAAYSDEEEKALPDGKYIVFGDHTRAVKWANFRFIPGESGTLVFEVVESAEAKYIYYALKNLRIESRGYNRHWTVLREFEIPVPPIEVQQEIVSILDTFTELASELEAELTARYQLRTWLQDELLKHRLSEATAPSQMMPITKAAEYIRGLTYSKSAEDIAGTIRVLRANNIDQESGTLNFRDVRCLATGTKVKREQKLSEGDILMSAASGSRSHVGKVAYIDDDLDYYFGGFMAVFRVRKNIHSPYLFHILSSRGFQEFLDTAIESTTINNLSASLLEKFLIPVPDLKTQIEISRRLDSLNCLIQDLRGELEMRQQQFDYFRGKLLTFKELEVA